MLAKGIIHVEKKQLEKLFGLPEDAEIVEVKLDDYGGIEFKVVSATPVHGITVETNQYQSLRRYHVGLSRYLKEEEVIARDIVNHLRARGENNDA